MSVSPSTIKSGVSQEIGKSMRSLRFGRVSTPRRVSPLVRLCHAPRIQRRVQLGLADHPAAILLHERTGLHLLQAQIAHRLAGLERLLGDRSGGVVADQRVE